MKPPGNAGLLLLWVSATMYWHQPEGHWAAWPRLGGALASTAFLRDSPQSPRAIAKGQEESQESLSGNSTVPTRLLGREDSIHHVQKPAGLSYIAEEAVAGGGAV